MYLILVILQRRSRHICFVDELKPGTRIQLTDGVKHSRTPMGTIMEQTVTSKPWFKVKLDMGGFMTLDLGAEEFKVNGSHKVNYWCLVRVNGSHKVNYWCSVKVS